MAGTALVIGITGQDGSYLAELLLDRGYEVVGTMRRSSSPNLSRLTGILESIELRWMDLVDASSIDGVIGSVVPDEVYNLGAMSDVGISFDVPDYSGQVTGLGALRVLDALRRLAPGAAFYQAGSSEMFGMNPDVPTNEGSTFHPASPYAAAKVYAYHATVNYREAYELRASNGILFNHESERRGEGFVTQKIARAVAEIHHGRTEPVGLGNLDACRDWGYAADYVEAMWLMVQADRGDDFVVATGETYSVREFADRAFALIGKNWQDYVVTDPRFHRPVDPPVLLGDATKARDVLGWSPTVTFDELVERMVKAAVDV